MNDEDVKARSAVVHERTYAMRGKKIGNFRAM